MRIEPHIPETPTPSVRNPLSRSAAPTLLVLITAAAAAAAIPLLLIPLSILPLTFKKRKIADPHSPTSDSLEDRFVFAATIAALFLVAASETLSAFNAIAPTPAIAAWWAFAIGAWTWAWSTGRRPAFDAAPLLANAWDKISAAFILVTLAIALASPVNTWDSLTYHLPRVMHWIQNANLEHYPTNILRQLWNAPFAEYAILHLHLLTGGDRFDNLVQWASMAACAWLAGDITLRWTGSTAARSTAILLIVTLPTGLLQASGTQNNYVGAFWLMCGLHRLVSAAQRRHWNTTDIATFAACMALAFFTKATTAFWMAGLCIWALVNCARCSVVVDSDCSRRAPSASVGSLRHFEQLTISKNPTIRSSISRASCLIAACALLMAAINGPFWFRNHQLFGSPIGPREYGLHNTKLTNDAMTPLLFGSNLVRVVSNHFATTIQGWNEAIESGVRGLHGALGLWVDDAKTTDGPYHLPDGLAHEDTAGSPVHVLLTAITIPIAVVGRGRRRSAMLAIVGVVALGMVGYLVVLRWQYWGNRLQLPGFVLVMIPVAMILSREGVLQRRVLIVCCGLASIAALPALLIGIPRAVLPFTEGCFWQQRSTQYLRNLPWLEAEFNAIADRIAERKAGSVGLDFGPDDWEYPFWVLLSRMDNSPTIGHIHVRNRSRRLQLNLTNADAIIIGPGPGCEQWVREYRSRGWRVDSFTNYHLAIPTDLSPTSTHSSTRKK